MLPTLADGTLIWLDRGWYGNHQPIRGEVVVFRFYNTNYVKRVYRGPGESLLCVIDSEGDLIPVCEANLPIVRMRLWYMARKGRPHLQVRRFKVPDDSFLALGDNPLTSVDSRKLGFIPLRTLLGRAHLPVDSTRLAQGEFSLPPMHEPVSKRLQAARSRSD